MGIMELKDVIWRELNSESNKIAGITTTDSIVHKNMDLNTLTADFAGWEDDLEPYDDEDEDFDDSDIIYVE